MNKNNKKLKYFPKKIAIVYSEVKREQFPTQEAYITEKDSEKEARIVAGFIKNLGIKVYLFPGDACIAKNLSNIKPDVVINFVTSAKGCDFLASSVIGVYELLEIPYTGAGLLGESLSNNKFLVKKLLEHNGIPVPNFQLFSSYKDIIDSRLRFPLISKLNETHGGVEINKYAVSENEKNLRERIKYLIKTYTQPILVEEFIVGKEVDAVLLEGSNKKVYLAECVISKKMGNYYYKSFEYQWGKDYKDIIKFKKYKDSIITEYVKKAFFITDMADYGRFDIRIDSSGRCYFIDSNSNPYLAPKEADSPIGIILDLYNIPFKKVMRRMLENTIRNSEGKKKLPIIP